MNKHILLILSLMALSSSVYGMEKCEEIKDQKKSKYAAVVQEMLVILTPTYEQELGQLEERIIKFKQYGNEFTACDLRRLWTKEEYAPPLKMFLEKKILDPDMSWSFYGSGRENSGSMLCEAVLQKAYRNVKVLLEMHASPNRPGRFQCYSPIVTPMYVATLNHDIKMLELLCENNANPNAASMLGRPTLPLSLAIVALEDRQALIRDRVLSESEKKKFVEILNFLLNKGADPLAIDSHCSIKFPLVKSPLELIRAYKKSFNSESYPVEELLLAKLTPEQRLKVDGMPLQEEANLSKVISIEVVSLPAIPRLPSTSLGNYE